MIPGNGFIADFKAAIQGAKEDHAAHIADGKAPDYAAYQKACGRIAGLEQALDLFTECVNAYFSYDDDVEVGPPEDS